MTLLFYLSTPYLPIAQDLPISQDAHLPIDHRSRINNGYRTTSIWLQQGASPDDVPGRATTRCPCQVERRATVVAQYPCQVERRSTTCRVGRPSSPNAHAKSSDGRRSMPCQVERRRSLDHSPRSSDGRRSTTLLGRVTNVDQCFLCPTDSMFGTRLDVGDQENNKAQP